MPTLHSAIRLLPVILSAFAFNTVWADDMSPPADAATKHVSINFTGNTVADKGLFGVVSQYIYEHRADKSCESIEAVHATNLPLVAGGNFPKRSHEDNLRDDAHELWDVTMCGKKQTNMVIFSFLKNGAIDYRISAMTSN